MASQSHTNLQRSASVSVIIDDSDDDAVCGSGQRKQSISVADLDALMNQVQSELDALRANPHGDRHVYEERLAELEHSMEVFHRSVARQLQTATPSTSNASKSCTNLEHAVIDSPEAAPIVDQMLTPLLDDQLRE